MDNRGLQTLRPMLQRGPETWALLFWRHLMGTFHTLKLSSISKKKTVGFFFSLRALNTTYFLLLQEPGKRDSLSHMGFIFFVYLTSTYPTVALSSLRRIQVLRKPVSNREPSFNLGPRRSDASARGPPADVLAHSIVTSGANHVAATLQGEQALERGTSAPECFCKQEATRLLLSQDLLLSPLRRLSSEYHSKTPRIYFLCFISQRTEIQRKELWKNEKSEQPSAFEMSTCTGVALRSTVNTKEHKESIYFPSLPKRSRGDLV